MSDLTEMTIKEARAKLDAKEISALELAESFLEKIEERNNELNIYLEVFSDVLEQARAADERLAQGERAPLLGIPISLKDNILSKGRKASASSKILENYVASYDATVVTKLKEQGAIFLGRTNCDEFAMGSSTENSAFGVTKNPLDTTRVPGGSSGGSAASVAAHMAMASFGSDTGGSIRQPASFCGVVGLKPTYGSVSRNGLIAMGSSLDVIGPFAHTTEDAEMLFDVTKGNDPLDATTLPDTEEERSALTKKIGVPRSFLEGIDECVKAAFEVSLQKLANAGHELIDIELPLAPKALAMYYIIMPAEASSNLARFDGMRFGLSLEGKDLLETYVGTRGAGFGKEVRRRILLGTYVLSSGYYDAYYKTANRARAALTQDFNKAFEQVDVIALPTTPTPPFVIGEKEDPLSMYLADIFTVPANLTGMPAISIPTEKTFSKENLPIGLQFIAPSCSEERLFVLGKEFESLR